ncbi:MAG: phosphoribosylformylglycinamidine synthase I, partial [Campylobacter hyointestinalis]
AMSAVVAHAKKGGLVLGICNGFQMLLETRLLEGAMRRNENMSFISKFHHLKVISNNNKFLSNFANNDVINIPIAHGEGNYYTDENTLKRLYDNEQIILKYCDENGNLLSVNGSIDNIAGICNKEKNIFGLMPHPERAIEEILGGTDGMKMLKGLVC